MGTYSANIPRKIAKTLVSVPKFFSKLNRKNQFWFAYGDDTLHYGEGHFQGSMQLNTKGHNYYNKFKKNRSMWL